MLNNYFFNTNKGLKNIKNNIKFKNILYIHCKNKQKNKNIQLNYLIILSVNFFINLNLKL
jgi:hypothetical protein